MEHTLKRDVVWVIVSLGLTLMPQGAQLAEAQDSVEPPAVRTGPLRDTLRGVTRDSGNAGFGDLISDLTALEVATTPLGTPAAGIVFRYEDDQSFRRQQLNFAPLLLGRAATSGRSTAMFGLNVATASYDTISDLPLDRLPIASFEGPAPVVSASTLDLSVETLMVTGFATLGLTDRLDVGVAVPVVAVTLGGAMMQQEAATGSAIFPVDASSFGIGDIGVTGQFRLWAGANIPDGLTARVTLRAPTGNTDELRGIDTWRTMASATASRGFGRLSVHGTAGFESWSRSVALRNTLPANLVETWLLKDQLRVGGGFELAASAIPLATCGSNRSAGVALHRRASARGRHRVCAATRSGARRSREEHHGSGDQRQHPGTHDADVSHRHVAVRLWHAGQAHPMIGLNWALCGDC